MFVTNENIHSHNTRNKNGYLIPSVRTNCRKFTVGYAGPILWNSFSQKLRQLPSEVISIIKLKREFFRTDPRIEPKFGTQVRIDTITLIG